MNASTGHLEPSVLRERPFCSPSVSAFQRPLRHEAPSPWTLPPWDDVVTVLRRWVGAADVDPGLAGDDRARRLANTPCSGGLTPDQDGGVQGKSTERARGAIYCTTALLVQYVCR